MAFEMIGDPLKLTPSVYYGCCMLRLSVYCYIVTLYPRIGRRWHNYGFLCHWLYNWIR